MIRSVAEWERACKASQSAMDRRRIEAIERRDRRERRHVWYWRLGLVAILTLVVAIAFALVS